jgi:hypothetical protein
MTLGYLVVVLVLAFVVAEASMVYLARRSLAAECDGDDVAAAQSGTQSNRACPRSTFTVEAVSRAPYYSEAGIQPLATSSLSRDCGRP